MRFRQYITEKYEKTISPHYSLWVKEPIEVFKNPTPKEYREVKNAMTVTSKVTRGLSDGKNIWIWRGDVFHGEIKKSIGLKKIELILFSPNINIFTRKAGIVFYPPEARKLRDKIYKFAPEFKKGKTLLNNLDIDHLQDTVSPPYALH